MATPQELAAASKGFGPKRVRTPNLDVEQFSPDEIQRMNDANTAGQVTINACTIFGSSCQAVPDMSEYHGNRVASKGGSGCGCSGGSSDDSYAPG